MIGNLLLNNISAGRLSLIVCFFPAASHTLLFTEHKLQQGNLLSCANIFLLQAIRCCVLIINCKIIFIVYLGFSPASHMLFYAYHKLQQGNIFSSVIISLLQAVVICLSLNSAQLYFIV